MARTSLLVHIVMIVIAATIAYLYIYPTIQQIRQNQDTAVVFDREVARVSAVNAQLQQKVSAINSIPLQDKQKLFTYMPDSIDDVSVMRTLETILIIAGIEPTTLHFDGDKNNQVASINNTSDVESATNQKTIQSEVTVAFESNEASLFAFFEAVEKSAVPFVVKEIKLTPGENGLISTKLIYKVYALAPESSGSTLEDNTMDNVVF